MGKLPGTQHTMGGLVKVAGLMIDKFRELL
jgi:hypothetical protein